RYCHGFVAVPVILSCKTHGLFELLQEEGPRTLDLIAARLSANSGHLQAALRLLHSLGWVGQLENGAYQLTAKAQLHREIPEDVVELLNQSVETLLLHDRPAGLLQDYVSRSEARWSVSVPLLADFLDGLLVLPLLTTLGPKGFLESADTAPGWF